MESIIHVDIWKIRKRKSWKGRIHMLHTLRFADFDTPGEDPAKTLEHITAYINKNTPIALPSDQTDAAKAQFLSNTIRGQTWTLHAKGRISASATY